MPAPTRRKTGAELSPTPEKLTKTLLALVVAAATFLDYWSYSRQYYSEPGAYRDVLNGTAAAPNQYRVGAVRAANFLAAHGHFGLRHGMTLIDGLSALVAVSLLYSILRRSTGYLAATNATRWFGSAALVVLVQFYLAWLIWFQRPETLPSAALVAVVLWLLTPHEKRSPPLPPWAIFVGLLLFSAIQGIVRADIAFAVNAGVLLICVTRLGGDLSLSRRSAAVTALMGLIISGGTQYLLMRIIYPHASYGSTPVVQILLNLTDHLRILPFLVFMVPWGWTMQRVLRRRELLSSASLALLAASTVFLFLWCTLGKIDEVRIFLPFALALAPSTAEIAMQQVSES